MFLLLGSSRSLYAAYSTWRERQEKTARKSAQKRAGLPKSWSDAAATWEWESRAEKFDANERLGQMQQWAERRDQLREQEWKFAQELLDKARQMLVFPLAKTVRTQQSGEQTIVTEVHPTRWGVGDVAKYLEAASKLGRLALGEETERVVHTFEISSDEMARARDAAAGWEKESYGED